MIKFSFKFYIKILKEFEENLYAHSFSVGNFIFTLSLIFCESPEESYLIMYALHTVSIQYVSALCTWDKGGGGGGEEWELEGVRGLGVGMVWKNRKRKMGNSDVEQTPSDVLQNYLIEFPLHPEQFVIYVIMCT